MSFYAKQNVLTVPQKPSYSTKSYTFHHIHHPWSGAGEATAGAKIQNQSQFPHHSTKFYTFHHYHASSTVASLRLSANIQNQTQFHSSAQFTPAPRPEIKAHKMIRSEVRMSPSWLVIAAALTGSASASAFAAPKAIATPGDPKLV